MFKKAFGLFLGILGKLNTSKLKPLTTSEQLVFSLINPFPNGRFQPPYLLNGASRKKKTNRLRLSKRTRQKNKR